MRGIPSQATQKAVWNAFVVFGQISDVTLQSDRNSCVVEFEEEGDAAAALDNMHLSELYGETIYVSYPTQKNIMDKRKAVWDA